ncbi:MAG: acyltransferase [Deltaproteobacteria bacterium]|nr:acyltransferase [Deltaproteobacteria bacterium]
MLNLPPGPLTGLISTILLGLNIFFWAMILYFFTIFKIILPFKPVRKIIDPILHRIAENWITGNSGWMRLTQKAVWDVRGVEGLRHDGWYLVNSNHQSWADIFVLQHVLNHKIPFMKILTKQALLYVPLMGLAWWALDFPFLRRYSREYLKKHPGMRGKDLEATRKACQKFTLTPTSVMNFLEGTRFTKEKHAKQNPPYRYLLNPKAGGFALLLNTMGQKFRSMLNITIVYPDVVPNFWDFLCGRMKKVIVRVEQISIPEYFIHGDYEEDPAYRESIQQWVHQLWIAKDDLIDQLLAGSNTIATSNG